MLSAQQNIGKETGLIVLVCITEYWKDHASLLNRVSEIDLLTEKTRHIWRECWSAKSIVGESSWRKNFKE